MATVINFPNRSALARGRWRLAGSRLQLKLARLRHAIKAGFNPDQPRAPAGQSDGGQWIDDGGIGSFRVAQNVPRGGRGGGRGRGESEFEGATPAQLARLAVARARADAAVARVRQNDPNWKPQEGAYETTEGEIANLEDRESQANARYVEILFDRVGFGPFAVDATPGRGPYTRPTLAERAAVNELGQRYGCHTCGSRTSGRTDGSWICDHQRPSALGGSAAGEWLLPHCLTCSGRQGWITQQILEYWKK
jgi:hypothetical protein